MRSAPSRDLAALLPAAPGVYRFRDDAGRVLYTGRAVSLRRRVASYWGDLGDRGHLAPMVARIAVLEAVACDSAHEAAWLERNLLAASLPPWNRSASGGQEVEVWIRLRDSARAPGLTVVHQPSGDGRHFGPYLGGRKARLAVAGLRRVLPLPYAGDGQTGTRREMARVLSVSAGDLAGLAEMLTGVLERVPARVAPVRAELAARRDAAAGALAFELAARLQEEIEALDWITAEQKVTVPSAGDFDVHGWASGVLVCFAIRGGRVSDWQQRPCDSVSARDLVARTPRDWVPFARRNAELAARLSGPGAISPPGQGAIPPPGHSAIPPPGHSAGS